MILVFLDSSLETTVIEGGNSRPLILMVVSSKSYVVFYFVHYVVWRNRIIVVNLVSCTLTVVL